ncbi:hypothetical protein [Nesterenkonia muleiensis]|uniref:hypothetical protein n=1 Tax=Nesterenkonia muleiensis TaxID=2282648 RepID=UPI000E756D09|nr:hypothetical protein [Nesterenkonia muleiensis]
MALTSIKVSKELRDQVSRLAQQQRMSQHAYLDQLLQEAEEKEFWRRMAEVSAEDYESAVKEDGDHRSPDYRET